MSSINKKDFLTNEFPELLNKVDIGMNVSGCWLQDGRSERREGFSLPIATRYAYKKLRHRTP